MSTEKNKLYYGDNLDVLRRYVKDESVDLVYLDPPFNSRQDYNVLFAEKDGTQSSSQIHAFEDTWEWNTDAMRAYEEIVEHGGRVADTMRAFKTFLFNTDMMAYLAMMAPRLVELRRVLKQTGSIYLHCDPTASHYLKILMDAVFGPQFFRNEVIWKRTTAHSDGKRAGRIHDVILFYAASSAFTWNKVYQPYEADYVEKYYRYKDENGNRWASGDCAAAGPGPARYFNGVLREPPAGSHWRFSQEKIDEYVKSGRIFFTENGFPRFKRYLEDMKGVVLQDIWADKEVQPVVSWSDEGLGYQTQKPEGLLERIIKASSNGGDVVLDPFCGCGTAVQVAQRLNRRWIGIDITHLAINLIKNRLRTAFEHSDPPIETTYEVIGEPTDFAGAAALADQKDKYQFQSWALGKVYARPAEPIKKGADRGIDGRLYFHDDDSGKSKQIIFSVKAGGVSVPQVRDLRGVLEREKAEIGVFLCFEEPTKPMKHEAAEAGLYKSSDGSTWPRLQILTIQQILDGKQPDYPAHRRDATFKKAPRSRPAPAENLTLPLLPNED